jgi:hypothetical protein
MLEEILKAIHALPKGKSLEHDNIPWEFFQECANEIAPTFLKVFTVILDIGEALASINKGLITLIPKLGDHSKLGNWRPITLFGSMYKILAKTLARRIQASLPRINSTRWGSSREEASSTTRTSPRNPSTGWWRATNSWCFFYWISKKSSTR